MRESKIRRADSVIDGTDRLSQLSDERGKGGYSLANKVNIQTLILTAILCVLHKAYTRTFNALQKQRRRAEVHSEGTEASGVQAKGSGRQNDGQGRNALQNPQRPGGKVLDLPTEDQKTNELRGLSSSILVVGESWDVAVWGSEHSLRKIRTNH